MPERRNESSSCPPGANSTAREMQSVDSFSPTQAGTVIYVYQGAREALKKGHLIQPGRIVRKIRKASGRR